MPAGAMVHLTVDGSTIRSLSGKPLDARGWAIPEPRDHVERRLRDRQRHARRGHAHRRARGRSRARRRPHDPDDFTPAPGMERLMMEMMESGASAEDKMALLTGTYLNPIAGVMVSILGPPT